MYFNNLPLALWEGSFSVLLKGHQQKTAMFHPPYCTINCIPMRGNELTSSVPYSSLLHMHRQGLTQVLSIEVRAGGGPIGTNMTCVLWKLTFLTAQICTVFVSINNKENQQLCATNNHIHKRSF